MKKIIVLFLLLAALTGCKQDATQNYLIETMAMAIGYELRGSFQWSKSADAYYMAIMEGRITLDGAKAAEGYLRQVTHPLIANRLVRLAGMVGFELDGSAVVGVGKVDLGLLKVAAQGFRAGTLLN